MPAWTAPRTWADGEQPTKAQLDTHIRDNLLALRWGAWANLNSYSGFAYGTGVVDYGASFILPQVRTTGDGREVELRGLLKLNVNVTAGTTILTIPTALRPTAGQLIFSQASDSSNQHSVRIDLLASGLVQAPAEQLNSGSALSLSGMRWAVS